jgi:hypothetical protein
MTVDLIIPFSFDDDERDAARLFVCAHYALRHPGLNVVFGVDPLNVRGDYAEWSKGRAVANGVSRSRNPILVVADADVIVPPEGLGYSIIAVMHGAAWSMPHGTVYRLSRRGTSAVYAAGELPAVPNIKYAERTHPGPHGGGMVVLTRAAYEATGIDPRFIGFGGDDISFARALDTLVGKCERFDFPMTHLFHERTPRRHGNRGSDANEALAARYMIADGDPWAMQTIIDEFKVSA